MADSLDILVRFMIDQAAQGNSVRAIGVLESKLKDFEEQIKDVKKESAEFAKVSQTLANASRSLLVGGTALSGGIFALANKYVKDAKEATAVTIAWKGAQEDLNRAGNRFGAVLAEEALPLLQKAAKLAETASAFVERNPEIVRAALNTGLVLAGLGAVGIAVSKGIKLIADTMYLAAVVQEQVGIRQFSAAVDKFLLGTATLSKTYGITGGMIGPAQAPSAAGKGVSLGTVALIATSVIISAEIGMALGNAIGKAITGGKTGLAGEGNFGLGDVAVGGLMAFQTPSFLAIQGLNKLGVVSDDVVKKYRDTLNTVDKFAAGLLGANKILNVMGNLSPDKVGGASASSSLGASAQFSPILKAYEQYKQDDLAMVQEHYKARAKITNDSYEAEKSANASASRAASKVRAEEKKSIADAQKQFAQAESAAAEQYQNQRNQIIRDGGEEIQNIERDSQERIRKLRIDSQEREKELIASRDALGLAKERRGLLQAESEERRSANLEIKQRRADIAQRLNDLQQSYEVERQTRFDEYQARLIEIKENATAQLAEISSQHRQELEAIRAQKQARLRELNEQLNEERKRKYNAVIQNIKDLDSGYLLERATRKKYSDLMLADLESFLSAYKSGLGSATGGISGLAEGGYTSGLVRTGERGVEWVASHSTTRAAEQIIGGRLTQENMLARLMGGGGQVVWNDNRRFDGAYTNEIRRANRKDTLDILSRAMKG